MPENTFAKRINEIFNNKTDINDPKFTQELFNLFADNYEQVMNNINYTLPQQLANILSPIFGIIIDLGCGTGLTGTALKNENNTLIGVDISDKMLQMAQSTNVYNQLILDDINHYCKNLPYADWVIAADVFGYVGNLDTLINNIYPRNLCFSIVTDDKCDKYRLEHNGRYRHNPLYIKKLLQKSGYSNIIEKNSIIRTENNSPVKGIIFIAKEK